MVEMCWSRHGKSPDSVASLIPSHPRFRRTPFAVFTTTTTTTTRRQYMVVCLWSRSALASPPHHHHRFIKEQGRRSGVT
ncbi:hypothetical protein HA466_0160400 [Hirschfeldia incana]|nr:hypothetical protein HA466_0160400 [Hirschfeldia incana]